MKNKTLFSNVLFVGLELIARLCVLFYLPLDILADKLEFV